MLLLTMNIGRERYGVDARLITEVIPLVRLDRVPMVDPCILGLFNYRGSATPVVDLCYFFAQRYCEQRLSSRIIIIDANDQQQPGKIGLVAECVTETIKCAEANFRDSGIASGNAAFLSGVYKHNNELIQILDPGKILPESITRQLPDNTSAANHHSV